MPEVEEVEYDEQKGLIDILEGLNDDGFPSKTSVEQIRVENIVERCLSKGMNLFHRSSHYYYIFPLSSTLPEYFSGLDASRCWLSYWILHSMDLLGILGQLAPVLTLKFVDFLNRCQNSSGGFGGGPQQLSHLAPTYAAVMSLAILGEDCALKVIDRRSMYAFLLRLKQPDGSFLMHEEGEADLRYSGNALFAFNHSLTYFLRASYCALAVASLLNILTEELLQNAEDYISKYIDF